MPEDKPKQEKGADPRILLYEGSDKEKLLNKIITELWCEESKYLPLHCILHAEAKKEEKVKEQICNLKMTTLTLLHLWVDTLSLHTLVPLIIVNGNMMPTIVIQW